MEPSDLWTKRLPGEWRNRAPQFAQSEQGAFQGHPGGFEPNATDGVFAEVLYPTLALSLFGMRDAALQDACFRAYKGTG